VCYANRILRYNGATRIMYFEIALHIIFFCTAVAVDLLIIKKILFLRILFLYVARV